MWVQNPIRNRGSDWDDLVLQALYVVLSTNKDKIRLFNLYLVSALLLGLQACTSRAHRDGDPLVLPVARVVITRLRELRSMWHFTPDSVTTTSAHEFTDWRHDHKLRKMLIGLQQPKSVLRPFARRLRMVCKDSGDWLMEYLSSRDSEEWLWQFPPDTSDDNGVPVTCIAFAPAGRSIAAGFANGHVRTYKHAEADAPRRLLGGAIQEISFRTRYSPYQGRADSQLRASKTRIVAVTRRGLYICADSGEIFVDRDGAERDDRITATEAAPDWRETRRLDRLFLSDSNPSNRRMAIAFERDHDSISCHIATLETLSRDGSHDIVRQLPAVMVYHYELSNYYDFARVPFGAEVYVLWDHMSDAHGFQSLDVRGAVEMTHSKGATSLTLDSNGKRLIGTMPDLSWTVWNTCSGNVYSAQLASNTPLDVYRSEPSLSAKYSIMQRRVVGHFEWTTSDPDEPATVWHAIRAWDVATGDEVAKPIIGIGKVCIAPSPDGTEVAIGYEDGRVRVKELEYYEESL